MILVGRYLSPFVRRVAATLHLYELPFEHRPLATLGEDREKIREVNPVTRVPALLLDDGEVLIDSGAIIDHLDEVVGPQRALTPDSGAPRRQVLKMVAVATGAAEKAVLALYEQRFRPEEKWHAPWVDMVSDQCRNGFQWLESQAGSPYLTGSRMTQADVSTMAAYEFVRLTNPELFETLHCPALEALSERVTALDAFKKTAPPA